jgi:hypothetical protein
LQSRVIYIIYSSYFLKFDPIPIAPEIRTSR